jgi:allantoate deiminase
MLKRAAPGRLDDRLEHLYAIGDGRGANRPGFSAAEDEALDLAAAWMEDAGLAVSRDAAGNLVGRLAGEDPQLPEVWTGSHLDSVPEGGKYDGALGVVAGLEAIQRLGRRPSTLAVVAFRAEETGCQGSRAFVSSGQPLPGAYVEVHVEQGPRLAAANAPLGVVSGIAAYLRRLVVFEGVAGHAGTTPMAERDDALVKAAEYILRAREAARDDAVATVGQVEVEPGAVNVIPGRVTVSVDVRAPDGARLEELARDLGLDPLPRVEPIPMDATVRAALAEELAQRGMPARELVSWAGHDAGVLAAAGVPSGMLFVRSLAGGASHTPDEYSSPEDVELAVDVLAGALARLAAR